MWKFGFKLRLKLNPSAYTQFKTEVKTELLVLNWS